MHSDAAPLLDLCPTRGPAWRGIGPRSYFLTKGIARDALGQEI